MKTNLFISLLPLVLIITAAGCSKGSNSGPANEDPYSKLVDNRTWSSDLKYTNKVLSETCNITFKSDGTLIWREHSGEFKGTYTLDKHTGTIRFGYMGADAVTATLSTDGKMSNFSYKQLNWILGDTKINNTELDLALDGLWKTDARQEDGTEVHGTFAFQNGNRVLIPVDITGVGLGQEIYARESGCIRFKYDAIYEVLPGKTSSITCNYFFVITPEKRLAGLESRGIYVNGILQSTSYRLHLLNKS